MGLAPNALLINISALSEKHWQIKMHKDEKRQFRQGDNVRELAVFRKYAGDLRRSGL
ncbi:MAG: hypothetical protein IKH50_01770 [Oscillospiraceae bacterium]|nr:hypothetical protein [Oscillospiraceae bacterium]